MHTTADAFLLWLSWMDVKPKEHFPVLSSSCGLSWALGWVTRGVLSKSRGVIMHSRDSVRKLSMQRPPGQQPQMKTSSSRSRSLLLLSTAHQSWSVCLRSKASMGRAVQGKQPVWVQPRPPVHLERPLGVAEGRCQPCSPSLPEHPSVRTERFASGFQPCLCPAEATWAAYSVYPLPAWG